MKMSRSPSASVPIRRIVGAALLASVLGLVAAASPAEAQYKPPRNAAFGGASSVGSASSVGEITRDENGRIFPAKPSPRAEASGTELPWTGPATRTAPQGVHPGQIPAPGFEPDRNELSERARQRQMEVARVLADEQQARQRGARVDSQGLTAREKRLLAELGREDSEVRSHELAHFYAGRPFTTDPEYWFVTGPLGGRFAVAGHVRFDSTPIAGDPTATLEKFETLRRAALAPAQPSTQDLKVVADIERAIGRIRTELAKK